jgi:hypothetical protein
MSLTTRRDRRKDGQLTVPLAPAPWSLVVDTGIVLPFLVRPGKSDLSRLLVSSDDRRDAHNYGLGLTLLVNYSACPVGGYDELLVTLPFDNGTGAKELTMRIPQIYVSTENSLRNGRRNWGIRKELADFKWTVVKGWLYATTTVKISDRLTGDTLLEASFLTPNLPFPVHIGLLGWLIPSIVERRIDEDGRPSEGSEWWRTRLGGFGILFL